MTELGRMERALACASLALLASLTPARAAAAGTGTIVGHIRLQGTARANPIIRMGMDPACAALRQGQRPTQELVLLDASGGLANAFVALRGTFPQTPVPSTPVVIDQRGCLYTPRVVGARVGQVLQVRNSDQVLHNVHSGSRVTNTFNVGQPIAGMSWDYRLTAEEVMLPLRCDVHSWMTAYVGVVSHPYFAVTSAGGGFEIDNVPAGDYPLQVWHEQFGLLARTVKVVTGRTVTVDLAFTGAEQH